jgi:DNA invertase Pin-like site-specific DNA recombinase
MKIAIYARVSTDDKGQDINLQIDRCKQYCQALEWEYEVFQDHESGYAKPSEERPGFSEMMNKIITREVDGVIVYAMDRFSREDPFKVYKSIETIHKVHKALFISITDGVDSRTDVFPIVLSVMSWLANNWSKAHSARVKAGIARKHPEGEGWGPNPLGIKKRNQLIRMRFVEGLGVRCIARELGISPGTVSKTLKKVREGRIDLPRDVPVEVLGNTNKDGNS